ncbi:unnamed protein product [Notodromas monacha]|uniref:CAF1B/HIR1 beta-propeller domain-containing protein n=1 Tax=Notodromas monacha TaxID=399045 RepID=A0A7R9BKP1_9CRUS|nr:unnamed protein product [Notodromas monacha]CAG0915941.1 unnamed protein product [Notodromas monacha]
MKCIVPEISWHNRDPVLSIDVQCGGNAKEEDRRTYRIATGGTDGHVEVWFVEELPDGSVRVECVSDLKRHNRAVNIVRFSPCGVFLASGDDESTLFIWKMSDRDDDFHKDVGDLDESEMNRDKWIVHKTLRGHLEDIQDLCWSKDSNYLVSGSIDNSAIIWDIGKGCQIGILGEHKGFVQGVAFDPKAQLIATLSTDRDLRIYNASTKKVIHRIGKVQVQALPQKLTCVLDNSEDGNVPKSVRLFHDDTLKTFSRRMDFSPDGEILFTPTGFLELGSSCLNTFYAFSRVNLTTPAVVYPMGRKTSALAVRCCPVLFKLRGESPPLFALPYRIVFAVITEDALILYDTQSSLPFGKIANIHYTRLSDLAWSSDGRLLMVSSTDGFCSFVTFKPDELGELYVPGETLDTTPSEIPKSSVEKTPGKIEKSDEQAKEEVPSLVSLSVHEAPANESQGGEQKSKMPFVIRARSAKHGSRQISIISTQKGEENSFVEIPQKTVVEEEPQDIMEVEGTGKSPETVEQVSPSKPDGALPSAPNSQQKKRVPFQTLSSPKTYRKKPLPS